MIKQNTFNVLPYLLCIFFALIVSCNNNSIPTTNIPDVQKIDNSIMIRNWQFKGPILNTVSTSTFRSKNQSLNVKSDKTSHNGFWESSINTFNYYQAKDYIPLDSVLKIKDHNTYKEVFGYASSILKSSIEQDVAFLAGHHGYLKIWLNGKLIMDQINDDNISKNRYTSTGHLKKGNNYIRVRLSKNVDSHITWAFHLDISSYDYVIKHGFGSNFFSISEHYLINEGDSLSLRIKYPAFIPAKRPARVQIINTHSNIVLDKVIPPGYRWTIALNKFKADAYKCRLITDADTLEQCFVYGDCKRVFSSFLGQTKQSGLSGSWQININTLVSRFQYLNDFASRNKHDEWIDRKISAIVFELGTVLGNLSAKREPFTDIPGLHVRGFRSVIDQAVDNYMLYMPKDYRPEKKVPLVVMMPYVTKQEPFLESWHVADITRIELIARLSDRYGFGVLWPSARIYRDYNLNPIVSTSTFEALNAIKKDYSIDENRLFLYGDCSGALQALLLANRFPSDFAAIGVEGPELSYLKSKNYPTEWVNSNNIIQTAENYKNIPILIFHTPTDEKAAFSITKELVGAIKKTKGPVLLDTLNNATKAYKFKLISEEVIISKVFDFFKNKKGHIPDIINFSTYQLKYNKSHWITIDSKEDNRKATVYAVRKDNAIKINTSNVDRLTIDANGISKINRKRPLTIIWNKKELKMVYPQNGQIVLDLTPNERTFNLLKTHMVEGPINDAFKDSFIVVSGTSGSTEQREVILTATDTFCSNWRMNFFNNCIRKKDIEIKAPDLLNHNLVLIGSEKTNSIIRRFKREISLNVTSQYVEIKGKRYTGSRLSYSFIHPNPANNQRYLLIIGTNYKETQWQNIKDFPLRGWYDYEVWNQNSMIDAGYFNKYWNIPLNNNRHLMITK